MKLIDLLIKLNYAKSKREAKYLISAGGITVNNRVIKDPEYLVWVKDIIEGSANIIVGKGKRQRQIVHIGFTEEELMKCLVTD